MACPAWVLSSIGAQAPELRRVNAHIERGGAILLHNDVDYIRVIQRGGQQPSTTTNGLTLNVTVGPPMTHQSGRQIGLSGQVYLPRKINVSTPHVCMPKYLLVDPQLNWMTVIPPEDVERTQNAIGLAVPSAIADSNVAPDIVMVDAAVDSPRENRVMPVDAEGLSLGDSGANPIGDRLRNSMLVMGSPFITAAFQLARNHRGLKTTFFLAGAGLLAATEYSETPVISHGAVWLANSTSDWRSDLWHKATETWERTNALFPGGIITLWMMLMCVLWSYLRKIPATTVSSTAPQINGGSNLPSAGTSASDSNGSIPNLVHGDSVPMVTRPLTDYAGSIPKPVHGVSPVTAEQQCVSLSGATSGVESGADEVINVEANRPCNAEHVLIDSNPRSPLSFVPCFSDNLSKCIMMIGDGVIASGTPTESALNDVAELCPVHLRMYAERIKLWRCRTVGCNEKGHHMDMGGIGIAERTSHLKQRLKNATIMPESEKHTPTLQSEKTPTHAGEDSNLEKATDIKASNPSVVLEQPGSHLKKPILINTVPTTALPGSCPPVRRQSLPVNWTDETAESSVRPPKGFPV